MPACCSWLPFVSFSSLVLAGGPIVAVAGGVISIGSPGDGSEVWALGALRMGTVRAGVWLGSGSLKKGLRCARSSDESIAVLPVKCQAVLAQKAWPRCRVDVLIGFTEGGSTPHCIPIDRRLLYLRLLKMKGALLCPLLLLICSYPRQGFPQARLPVSLAARPRAAATLRVPIGGLRPKRLRLMRQGTMGAPQDRGGGCF